MEFPVRVWVSAFWFVLRIIGFNFPVDKKVVFQEGDYAQVESPTLFLRMKYYQFVVLFCQVVPSTSYRKDLNQALEDVHFDFDKDTSSRAAFSKFIDRLYRQTCKLRNRPSQKQSFFKIRDVYECFRAKCLPISASSEQGCVVPKEFVPSKTLMTISEEESKNNNDDDELNIDVDIGCFQKLHGEDEDGDAAAAEKNLENDENYNSNDGFSTLIWGPVLWLLLHMISFSMDESKADIYLEFMMTLKYVLACGTCRDNLPVNLRSIGANPFVDFKTQADFVNFIRKLHNEVSLKTKQQQATLLTEEELAAKYEEISQPFFALKIHVVPVKNKKTQFTLSMEIINKK